MLRRRRRNSHEGGSHENGSSRCRCRSSWSPSRTLPRTSRPASPRWPRSCAACHGATGVSVSDAIPNLAAQKPAYLEAQLKALKDGTRKNPIMNAIASQLTPTRSPTSPPTLPTQPGAATTAKSDFLPNLVKTSVTFPEGYQNTFMKYHTINFPATRQVRYYFANKAAVQRSEGRQDAAGRLGAVRRGLLGEARRRREAASTGADGFFVAGQAALLHGDGARRRLGQGHSGHAAQRGLELRGVHDRRSSIARASTRPSASPATSRSTR